MVTNFATSTTLRQIATRRLHSAFNRHTSVYAITIRTGVGYPVVYPWVEGNAKARDQKDRRR